MSWLWSVPIRRTTMDAPVYLTEPMPDPEPVPGCRRCAALAEERRQARAYRNLSRVSDCNVELRAHPHRSGRRP